MTQSALYLLARNDLASLNPGKLAAQCAHAANFFEMEAESRSVSDDSFLQTWQDWASDTHQNFGTTIVLGAPIDQIRTVVDAMSAMGYLTGVVHDPTYPIRDGDVTHLIPLDTCAFVFVADRSNDDTAKQILGKIPLYQ
jgi:peptidyl-tRNA hydrolase